MTYRLIVLIGIITSVSLFGSDLVGTWGGKAIYKSNGHSGSIDCPNVDSFDITIAISRKGNRLKLDFKLVQGGWDMQYFREVEIRDQSLYINDKKVGFYRSDSIGFGFSETKWESSRYFDNYRLFLHKGQLMYERHEGDSINSPNALGLRIRKTDAWELVKD